MSTAASMPIKFFPRDVEGKKPRKIGDKFQARFLGETGSFKVTEMHDGFFFAVLCPSRD
ncbi:hypothetical protein G6L37_04430 [Agrobacterium rubi]|nr:hypothetical protein [Agrobacterium rubi]NTF24599.1 hypothetical protein [Agrobacterium rubi]